VKQRIPVPVMLISPSDRRGDYIDRRSDL